LGNAEVWIMLTNLRHQFVLGLKRLIYSRRGEPYRVKGHTLRYLPGTRPVRLSYIHSQNAVVRYDALQVQLLSTQLSEGDTVIDVGAHSGELSILMAALCGHSGQVVAFEPDPYAREMLIRNLALNPDITRPMVEAYACSDTEGEATLYSHGGGSNSSLVRSGVGLSVADNSEKICVPTVTLDAYIAAHNLKEPRWVKIDTEGAEIRILKGSRRLLNGNSGILCELHPYAWAEFGNTLDELKGLAAAAGRRIRYIDQDSEIGANAEYGIVLLERKQRG